MVGGKGRQDRVRRVGSSSEVRGEDGGAALYKRAVQTAQPARRFRRGHTLAPGLHKKAWWATTLDQQRVLEEPAQAENLCLRVGGGITCFIFF